MTWIWVCNGPGCAPHTKKHLPNLLTSWFWGKYASDAYEIFVLKRISAVQPSDMYLRWKLGGMKMLFFPTTQQASYCLPNCIPMVAWWVGVVFACWDVGIKIAGQITLFFLWGIWRQQWTASMETTERTLLSRSCGGREEESWRENSQAHHARRQKTPTPRSNHLQSCVQAI